MTAETPTEPSRTDSIASRRGVLRSIGVGVTAGLFAQTASSESTPHEDPKLVEQYTPHMIRAPLAWEDERTRTDGHTSGDVTIGIVDAGVDYTHPDLEAQFGEHKGHDFYDEDDDDPKPDPARWYFSGATIEMHGTHVAGIAAGTTGNGTGISGVSNARLLAARISGGVDLTSEDGSVMGGEIDLQTGVDAVKYLVDEGVDVLNLSVSLAEDEPLVRDAVTYALERDVLVVAAAGNRDEHGIGYPARYDDVLSVAGVAKPPAIQGDDHPGERTDYWNRDPVEWGVERWSGDDIGSQYGPNVDLCAPAHEVLSLLPSGRWWHPEYFAGDGTSMATPVVTGVAALALGKYPDLGAVELKEHLVDSTRDLGLDEAEQGAGLIDAAAAVGLDDCSTP